MRDARGRFNAAPTPTGMSSPAERRRGHRNAVQSPPAGGRTNDPIVLAWVWRKVRGYYRARRSAG